MSCEKCWTLIQFWENIRQTKIEGYFSKWLNRTFQKYLLMNDNLVGTLLLFLHKCSWPDPGSQYTKLICRCGIVDLEAVMLSGVVILNYAWRPDLVIQTLTNKSFLLCQTDLQEQAGSSKRPQVWGNLMLWLWVEIPSTELGRFLGIKDSPTHSQQGLQS
jgi:hypothetical protein